MDFNFRSVITCLPYLEVLTSTLTFFYQSHSTKQFQASSSNCRMIDMSKPQERNSFRRPASLGGLTSGREYRFSKSALVPCESTKAKKHTHSKMPATKIEGSLEMISHLSQKGVTGEEAPFPPLLLFATGMDVNFCPSLQMATHWIPESGGLLRCNIL